MIDLFVVDEVHEEAKRDSARARAMGSLAAASVKTLGMTGTLIGGKAEDVQPTLFRIWPDPVLAGTAAVFGRAAAGISRHRLLGSELRMSTRRPSTPGC